MSVISLYHIRRCYLVHQLEEVDGVSPAVALTSVVNTVKVLLDADDKKDHFVEIITTGGKPQDFWQKSSPMMPVEICYWYGDGMGPYIELAVEVDGGMTKRKKNKWTKIAAKMFGMQTDFVLLREAVD